MGKPTGFIEFFRKSPERRSPNDRVKDFQEFYKDWSLEEGRQQGARCMNCAVPFCHRGCPLGNLIPDWNDLVYKNRWEAALTSLHATNNFPDFTGRICPAPCEAACVLAINDQPVAIEHIEKAIADRGFDEGWIKPQPPMERTGKRVAVIGSGPAGLAAAQQLNKAGHWVTVFERDETIGGLLSLGIPDFKLDKRVVQRRITLMVEEGIQFRTNSHVGLNIGVPELKKGFDAILLCGGSTEPRKLSVPGSELTGVYFAMDYLTQQNRLLSGQSIGEDERITAKGKRVVILGGGDTGSDCLGTAHRQGAKEVHQFEIMPTPSTERVASNPWPQWPLIFRNSHAHEEGGTRDYGIMTKALKGKQGRIQKLHGIRLGPGKIGDGDSPSMLEIPGSEFALKVDMVLLAMGFLHPEHKGMLEEFGVELDQRGNVKTNIEKMTNTPGIFAAGDMARGQSLVVWAIAEGRQAAHGVDKYLMGRSDLPMVDLFS